MNIKAAPITFAISAAALLVACTAPTSTPAPTPLPSPTSLPSPTPVNSDRVGWNLIWQDEFEGETLDTTKWTFDLGGHGWGNGEWQTYTDRPENVRVENGNLVIEAREETELNTLYSSARLKTQGLHAWQYGRIEARLKLPQGRGLWPAFWLLGENIIEVGWPASGEIDIMEFIGREPDHIYGTVHAPGYSGGEGVDSSITLAAETLQDDFHIYAIEWEVDEIRWYVDDQQYFKLTPQDVPGPWIFDHEFFIILNVAVGGAWPGYPDTTTQFPQFMVVDYVRVYQRP